MSLKMKLTASISAFFLVVGLMLIGIMAVNQATVNMGGSISFTATDVYARVTGSIENAQGEYADKELPTLEFSAENGTPDQSEWSGLNLLFDDDATPIVITVTVENLARDRKLTASLTDNTAINENLVKDLKQDGVTYTSGTTKDLDASTGDGTSTTTYVVTFSIADHNKSLPQMDFDFDLNLYDESEAPLEILDGFVFDNGTLISYTGNDTEVVIPSSYSFIETVDMELKFSSYEDFATDVNANMSTYMSMTNFTVTIDGSQYGPYNTFEEFAMVEDVVTAMESATSIIINLQLKNQYVKGDDYTVTAIADGYYDYNTHYGLIVDNVFISNPSHDTSGAWNNTTIKSIILPETLLYIGDAAFAGCTALENIEFQSSLVNIGDYAFSFCSALETIDLSKCTNLKSIGDGVFNNCRTLVHLNLPSSLESIGEFDTFNSCINLQPSVTEQGVEYLGNSENPYVVLWDVTDDITTSVYTVNEGCKIIYRDAFQGYSGLTSITLPSSLTSIGSQAFYHCFELETLEYKGTIEQWLSIDFGSGWMGDASHTFIVNGEELTNLVVPEGVTSIGERAFFGCSGLTSIDLSNCTSLTSIGSSTFEDCGGLTEVDLSNCTNLTSIGGAAFSGCSGLTSIDLSNCTNLTSIEGVAFYGCSGLTSVTINQYVFENVTSTSSSYGYILCYIDKSGETVLVPANLIDDLHLTNSYLDDESEFTRSETANEDGYYVYTKK